MKHIKQYIFFLSAFAVMAGFVSCKKDFLDRKPLGRYTEDDIPQGSYESKVFALYALQRSFSLNGNMYLAIENFRDDLSEKGSDPGDGAPAEAMYDQFQYNKSDGGIADYWTANYAIVIAANEIISDIDSLNLDDPNTQINKAEAQFMRAFAYYRLVRAFGEVPLFTFKVTDAAQVNVPKSAVGQIFQRIDDDVRSAVALLPVRWDAQYAGRLTQGAALALQTDAAMWRKDWAGALAAATQIINSGVYSLVPNYRSQFTREGENGPESIFEIQAYFSQTQNYGIQYAQPQGVRGAGAWDLGWGWNVPRQKLVDEFEPGDPRKAATILFSGQTDPYYGQQVPGYPTPLARPYWNMKVYTNPADRTAFGSRFGEWMNHRIYRYADILLRAAEAANELGGDQNQQNAIAWLEQVRARARGTNAGILPKVVTTDKDEFRKAIRHERIVELAMEEKRFYDLVRWELDVTVLPASGSPNYQAKHRLLPIPQGEIDKSGGVLIQNPDYQ